MFGARWFIPYLAVSLWHVVSLVAGVDDAANDTKFFLMPALLFAVVGRVRLKVRAAEAALLVALACAWIGDILVSDTGNSGFIIGLAAFLLTHVVYFVLFIGSVRSRRIPWAAALLLVWWIGMLVLLREDLGVFLLPLAVYGLVLGASTAAAFATNATITAGAVLFLASRHITRVGAVCPDGELVELGCRDHDPVLGRPAIDCCGFSGGAGALG